MGDNSLKYKVLHRFGHKSSITGLYLLNYMLHKLALIVVFFWLGWEKPDPDNKLLVESGESHIKVH